MPTDNEFTEILGWPGYRVYQHAIDEQAKRLQLWVRRKRGTVPAGGWVTLPLAWDITPAESAHQCIRCEIADWDLPEDPVDAIALASDDVWLSNNWAQQVPRPGISLDSACTVQ